MPYATINDLPYELREQLPRLAQEIYREEYNRAWEAYEDPNRRLGGGSREQVSRAKAWSAVEQEYEKDKDGVWHRKELVVY